MQKAFLTAEWRNLLMANYEIDPAVLKPYLPCYTELDDFNGVHYVSLVGFLFKNTRIKGIAFPFHTTFEEVNLRFYVRFRKEGKWRRGVVFVKEIVPKRMITFVANTIYNEKYATLPMKHIWQEEQGLLNIEYYWKISGEWNYIKATAQKEPLAIQPGSEEEFITEHYWGYTFVSNSCTGSYEVTHPKWRIHPVKNYDILCNAGKLYGKEFSAALNTDPKSIFLAEGSPIKVMHGKRLINSLDL